jgi:hypothetical protein
MRAIPLAGMTFGRYVELPFDTADILAAFAVGFVCHAL